jgi:hypothetical protein
MLASDTIPRSPEYVKKNFRICFVVDGDVASSWRDWEKNVSVLSSMASVKTLFTRRLTDNQDDSQ